MKSTSEKCDPDSQSLAEIKEMPKINKSCKSGQYQNRLITCISCSFCEQNIHYYSQEILFMMSVRKEAAKLSN